MGVQQSKSKEELLYQQVNYGNVQAIKALHHDGAGLEWVDGEGRTPLTVACMKPGGLQVVNFLIELGADVNAHRPGSHVGTPLHHAAERGSEKTVRLLLSHGANALRLNDDNQTALDLARPKGHYNVIRTIESHISLFSGWLRELYGPSSREAPAPQLLSRKIWAVVLPCDCLNPLTPHKYELVIYSESQKVSEEGKEVRPRRHRSRRRRHRMIERKIAKSCVSIAVWSVKIEELNTNQLEPVVRIFDGSTGTEYKFLSLDERDKQQLLLFYDACRGMPQTSTSPTTLEDFPNPSILVPPASAPPYAPEDSEFVVATNTFIQSAMAEGVHPYSQSVSHSTNINNERQTDSLSSSIATTSGCAVCEAGPATCTLVDEIVMPDADVCPIISTPSAASVDEETFANEFVHYPLIDSSPVSLSVNPLADHSSGTSKTREEKVNGDESRSCVICLDAAVEGACVPCGHMAGCMDCLNEIKTKGWGCPICRAKIDEVIKLFAV